MMIHETSDGESSSSFISCCMPMHGEQKQQRRRRRRQSLSLAAAAATAAAAAATVALIASVPTGAGAFSSPPLTPSPLVSSYATTSQHSQRMLLPRRQRPLLHTMDMVSYLQAPPLSSTPPPPFPPKKKKKKQRSTIEPKKYDFLVLDEFDSDSSSQIHNDWPYNGTTRNLDSTLSLRHAPDIDSEILFEGTISKSVHHPSTLFTATATEDADSTGEQSTPALYAAATTTTTTTTTTIESDSQQLQIIPVPNIMTSTTTQPSSTISKRSKSSTMPGFLKDTELDEHNIIANLGLRRLHSSSYSHRRLTTRKMTRSKLISKLHRRQQQQANNSESLYKKSASVPDSLRDYAHEFHSIHRVTPSQEKELGTKAQEAMRLRRLHSDLQSKYGRHPTDDEWCAAAGKINVVALKEAMEDGLQAKNQLVASNLRMVQRVVNLYIRNGLGSEYNAGDLMQDGTMALIRAAEKYEPDRGFRFSTYAMYWIRSAIKRSQTTQSRIVTVPQRIHETHKRIAKTEVQLRKELGREPSKAELAKACEITTLQLDRCRSAMRQVTYSLDAEVQNSHKPNSDSKRKDSMYDIVEGKVVDETEYEKTQRLLMKEHLIDSLKRYLLPHEVDLLLLRYGLMDERALPRGMSGPMTIAEVSELVGLKPDKVRRIIINCQKQLRPLMKEWENFEYEVA